MAGIATARHGSARARSHLRGRCLGVNTAEGHYAIARPEAVKRMVFFGPVPPRRGKFWQRFAANMSQRLDSAARARQANANRRLADPNEDTRKACRDYWAVGMRPRLAEPDRTLTLIKSDLCASDPAGIRYGLTITNRVVMASYGNWDLRDRLRHLDVPTLVVHGEQESIPMDLVEEWVTALPHARLFKVPRAAHFTYAEAARARVAGSRTVPG